MTDNKPDDQPKGNARFGKGQPAHYAGRKGRSGAPRENHNSLRHGLASGKLPKGCQYVENRINQFRRNLEQIVIQAKGEISLVDAANVNSACKWERHGLLAAHWLRTQVDELSPSDRLKFSEAIAKASDNRDKAIRALGLNEASDKPPWLLPANVTEAEQ